MKQPSEPKPAPGDLRLVQAFLNTVDPKGRDELASPPALAIWLATRALTPAPPALGDADLERALAVREGLRALMEPGAAEDVVARLDEVASGLTLRARFAADGTTLIEPTADGFDGALGRLVAIAARTRCAGMWKRFKLCADDRCRRAFYDDSPNVTRRWCTPRCGNRVHARTFRRRKKRRVLSRGW